jgi:hypothetical protein
MAGLLAGAAHVLACNTNSPAGCARVSHRANQKVLLGVRCSGQGNIFAQDTGVRERE